jgi:hypothetical protein
MQRWKAKFGYQGRLTRRLNDANVIHLLARVEHTTTFFIKKFKKST